MPRIASRTFSLVFLGVLFVGTGCPHKLPDKLECVRGREDSLPPVQSAAEVSPEKLYAGGVERYVVVIDIRDQGTTAWAYGVDTEASRIAWMIKGEPGAVGDALGLSLPKTDGQDLRQIVFWDVHGSLVVGGGKPPIRGGEPELILQLRSLVTQTRALKQVSNTPTTCEAR